MVARARVRVRIRVRVRVRIRLRVRARAKVRARARVSTLVDFLSRGSTVLLFFITGSGSRPPNFVKDAFRASRSIHRLLVLKNWCRLMSWVGAGLEGWGWG